MVRMTCSDTNVRSKNVVDKPSTNATVRSTLEVILSSRGVRSITVQSALTRIMTRGTIKQSSTDTVRYSRAKTAAT